MFEDVPFRRELTQHDLERMRIPSRYWKSTFERLSDDGGDESLRSLIAKYIANMSEMLRVGGGFIFFGENGTGKTCASVVLGKEFRRRGNTVLYMEAADLKRMVIEKEYFDESETFWDRARNVDVLVVDDFGKGIMDGTGFGASLFDELIRSRNARKRVTIITANIDPEDWIDELGLKISTMKTLEECVIPVKITGANQREGSGLKLRDILS